MLKKIQIVSFDVPYPPNYGGVIDVYYKIKAFNDLGIKVTLHTFEYGRGEQKKLEQVCDKVYYYNRKGGVFSLLSMKPYIVKTRSIDLLHRKLIEVDEPILFEGIHTTSFLSKKKIELKTLVRTHNIEHNYYNGLAKSESSFLKKTFFKIEAYKLNKYEKVLDNTDHILSISPMEQNYFSNSYGDKATYIPVFFNDEFTELQKEQNFVLWHGDLRVSDNVKSALMAIDVIRNTNYKLVIASSIVNLQVVKASGKLPNVVFNSLDKKGELDDLLSSAKVNLLFTFQQTGIKLKLLNALVKSRFVIANNLMVSKTGLETTCVVVDKTEEIREQLNKLMNLSFSEEERIKRKRLLKEFDILENAQKIIDLI